MSILGIFRAKKKAPGAATPEALNSKKENIMQNTIVHQTEQGELFTTSEAIAEGAGVEHRAVLQMIEKYSDKIEERFGGVAFRMRPFETPGGIQQKRIAQLTEQQATFILTLARNTDRVVTFKADLVAEFDRMAKQLRDQQPTLTREERLALAVIDAQKMLTEKDERIAELEPAADAWAIVVSTTGTMSFRDAAKALHDHGVSTLGGNQLIEKCLEWGWLYRPQTTDKDRDKGKTPAVRSKQTKINQGVFEHKAKVYIDQQTGEKKISSSPQVRVTGKGLDAIRKRLTRGQLLEVVA